MNWIKFPELTNSVIYTFSFYILLAVIAHVTEASGKFNLPYSKFAGNKGINPRIGMLIIYFLPILIYLVSWINAGKPSTLYHILCLSVFIIHFGKRCLEVLFLHRFSGKIGIWGVIVITIAYSNIAFVFGNLHNSITKIELAETASGFLLLFGFLIFISGTALNFYHHVLLARLRSDEDDKSYKTPTGGLFKLLICPHYFFELVAWLGIAIVSTYIDSYLIFLIMAGYLSGRSNQTREWYIKKIAGFPMERKRIFPYLY
ncbi:hypothetical protein [Leptospira sp. GIMC2001]|uniref:hypothetical protein n=1 Tax=Leptospira sp. GIMC2001 TaxID=1513297 RepID=UPI002349EF56|nr:hypothetical protein [Leptospira sp. GIMC2001]WCL49571.1 hypothetical protein O4O04_01780 [Leptospira sp. GIMC2001]